MIMTMLMGVRRAEVRWQDRQKETNLEEDKTTDKGWERWSVVKEHEAKQSGLDQAKDCSD